MKKQQTTTIFRALCSAVVTVHLPSERLRALYSMGGNYWGTRDNLIQRDLKLVDKYYPESVRQRRHDEQAIDSTAI